MKFFAIIFLATLSYIDNPDKTENLYSYQLQFQSYDQCLQFYEDYQDKLLNGLLGHGKERFGNMQIDYVSCAEVEITTDLEIPNVIGQKPVYQRM
jgi:hypothetical protein|tara:strand:- start:7277 stop:7561 length:285 start_codon:yes stop_codon:yes gene_type:complete